MKINRIEMVMIGVFTLAAVYLFAQAPAPIQKEKEAGEMISIKALFDIVAHENNVVRSLWTKEIVGAGKKVGLKFSEDWAEESVDAGPLPALLLREVSKRLEKSTVPLSLFLGSDYPIAKVNRFDEEQMKVYKHMLETNTSAYFYDSDSERYTAMYPDFAVSGACVSCHNDHEESPKKDWKLGEMMGATTWMHPKAKISRDELIKTLRVLRLAVYDAYSAYIAKTKTFQNPPQVGHIWPKEGVYAIPSADVFFDKYTAVASQGTTAILLKEDVNASIFERE